MNTTVLSMRRLGATTIVMGLSLWLCPGCVKQAPSPSSQPSKRGGDVAANDSQDPEPADGLPAQQAPADRHEEALPPTGRKPSARPHTQEALPRATKTVTRRELLDFGFVESEDPVQRVDDREDRIRNGLPILTTYRVERVILKDLADLLGFELDDIAGIPGSSRALPGSVAMIRGGRCHLGYEPREQWKNPEAVVDATVRRYEPQAGKKEVERKK